MIDEYFIKPSKVTYPYSGWKLQISGENEQDSKIIKNVLENIIEEYSLGWKLLTQKSFDSRNEKKKNQYKASTIYLSQELINSGKQRDLVKNISSALMKVGYKKDIQIFGSKKITPSVYYRYDFNISSKKEGFSRDEYKKHYRETDENFNIENNPDIF